MARMQVAVAIAVVAAVLLAAAATTSEAAVTCGQVNSAISPCLTYARGQATAPSSGCCSGVRSLNAAASSSADKRTACNCLKNAAEASAASTPATPPASPPSAASASPTPSAPPPTAPGCEVNLDDDRRRPDA